MNNYSFIALFTDPMNYYALKAVFYDYLVKGKNSSEVNMINLNTGLNIYLDLGLSTLIWTK